MILNDELEFTNTSLLYAFFSREVNLAIIGSGYGFIISPIKLPNFSKISKSLDYEFFTINSEKRANNILPKILKSLKALYPIVIPESVPLIGTGHSRRA
mgnify:CR=1 FL=1